ncbi:MULTISPECIES: ParB/RepB/Spo0J family partition protein [Clostridia]|uniref:ParB/RepB/Spo0J family partition protein n=1 Tax=Clostridia TaxID=186801 RepID=UPI001FAA5293|nr:MULTISPECIES: ParB N-terminal domain-containing protein [Clostridia]
MAWNVMEQLNANAKKAAVGDNTPKAHFRTQDVSINKMYSNDKNFYSVEDIEPLAQKILLVGLMENLEVVHDPCDRGEYRIIAGERRWRALKILVEKGYTEFEKATCQIQTPASEEEETLRLIIANDYRNKTVSDLLEEEDKLKKILQRMKENGQKIMGIDLNSGRIRDVVAYFLKIAPTKVAQIESINKRLIPEFSKELKEGRLTFSAAYMISGMNEETQAEMLERYQENGLTYKEVKEIKQQQEEKAAAEQIEGQMDIDQFTETEEEIEEPEDDAEDTEDEDEWEDAHPESITSLCYSCKRYSDCNVKTGTCQSCDQYINKAEAEKTEEERYSEEQDAIDRETAKKLREKADEEKMQQLPSDSNKDKCIRMSQSAFEEIEEGKPYIITKDDSFRKGQEVTLIAFKEGKATGQQCKKTIICVDTSITSSALEDGYCILGLGEVEETLQEAATGAGQDADNRTLQYGA